MLGQLNKLALRLEEVQERLAQNETYQDPELVAREKAGWETYGQ